MLLGFASFAERPFSTVADDNSVNIQVTGNALAISIGTPTIISDSTASPSGSQVTLGAGTVTITGTANVSLTGAALTLNTGEPGVITWNEIIPGVNMTWTEIEPY